ALHAGGTRLPRPDRADPSTTVVGDGAGRPLRLPRLADRQSRKTRRQQARPQQARPQPAMEPLIAELKQHIVADLDLEDVTAEQIGTDEALFVEGLGLDSLDAVELVVMLERHY